VRFLLLVLRLIGEPYDSPIWTLRKLHSVSLCCSCSPHQSWKETGPGWGSVLPWKFFLSFLWIRSSWKLFQSSIERRGILGSYGSSVLTLQHPKPKQQIAQQACSNPSLILTMINPLICRVKVCTLGPRVINANPNTLKRRDPQPPSLVPKHKSTSRYIPTLKLKKPSNYIHRHHTKSIYTDPVTSPSQTLPLTHVSDKQARNKNGDTHP